MTGFGTQKIPTSHLKDGHDMKRAITHEVFFKIYSNVNQMVYLSLPINSPSFKALAPTLFFRYFADNIKMPQITKGHNS